MTCQEAELLLGEAESRAAAANASAAAQQDDIMHVSRGCWAQAVLTRKPSVYHKASVMLTIMCLQCRLPDMMCLHGRPCRHMLCYCAASPSPSLCLIPGLIMA